MSILEAVEELRLKIQKKINIQLQTTIFNPQAADLHYEEFSIFICRGTHELDYRVSFHIREIDIQSVRMTLASDWISSYLLAYIERPWHHLPINKLAAYARWKLPRTGSETEFNDLAVKALGQVQMRGREYLDIMLDVIEELADTLNYKPNMKALRAAAELTS